MSETVFINSRPDPNDFSEDEQRAEDVFYLVERLIFYFFKPDFKERQFVLDKHKLSKHGFDPNKLVPNELMCSYVKKKSDGGLVVGISGVSDENFLLWIKEGLESFGFDIDSVVKD